jgi:hypothetical protein
LGVGKGADLQQSLPVGVVARQARDFQPHDDPRMAQADIADQPLKSLTPSRRRAGLALVVVDDDNLLVTPTQSGSASTKRILPLGAFGVLDDLAHRGLADVEVGPAFKVMRLDFEVCIHGDLRSSLEPMAIDARRRTTQLLPSCVNGKPAGDGDACSCDGRGASVRARAHPHIPRRRKSVRPLRASGGRPSPKAAARNAS